MISNVLDEKDLLPFRLSVIIMRRMFMDYIGKIRIVEYISLFDLFENKDLNLQIILITLIAKSEHM